MADTVTLTEGAAVAVEVRVDADDQWFVGEDRTLRFRFVDGDTDGVETWTMLLEVFAARAPKGALPLYTEEATGVARTITTPAYATVTVSGDKTLEHGPGIFQIVLSRTDPGNRTILAYGPAEIRSAVRT